MTFDPAKPSTVYSITNTITGKQYIGATVNYRDRIYRHWRKSSSKLLRADMEKYGKEAFTAKALAVCSLEYAGHLEAAVVKAFRTLDPHGYNRTPDGQGAGKGHKWPADANRVVTPETRAARSKARKGTIAWSSRIIIDGVYYKSMKDAGDALGVHKATISWRAKTGVAGYTILGRKAWRS